MAALIENVVMSAGECTLTLLPEFGGKIASLHAAGHSLLQSPLNPLAPRTRGMDFSDSDASGWDECLPSVGACTVATASGSANIPDHGDLWRIPWQVLEADETSATLSVRCFSLPLELTRSALLSETASGWRLSLFYTLANRGTVSVPWAWSAHPLFSCEPGDRIVLPPSVKTLHLEGSGGGRLSAGKSPSEAVSWPIASLADGSRDDLSVAKDAGAGIGDKLFAGPLDDGWCALERPGIGLRLTLRYDAAATPYLGLWICYGGWPDRPGPKQVCVALEPTTAPADSLAQVISQSGPGTRSLAPNETFSWPMELEIDRIPHRNEANSV